MFWEEWLKFWIWCGVFNFVKFLEGYYCDIIKICVGGLILWRIILVY